MFYVPSRVIIKPGNRVVLGYVPPPMSKEEARGALAAFADANSRLDLVRSFAKANPEADRKVSLSMSISDWEIRSQHPYIKRYLEAAEATIGGLLRDPGHEPREYFRELIDSVSRIEELAQYAKTGEPPAGWNNPTKEPTSSSDVPYIIGGAAVLGILGLVIFG